nr:MAG TPA: hypothetical protein [Caudoviricetes sp.]
MAPGNSSARLTREGTPARAAIFNKTFKEFVPSGTGSFFACRRA